MGICLKPPLRSLNLERTGFDALFLFILFATFTFYRNEPGSMKQQKRNLLRFLINNLLILTGMITAISGFVIQVGFHIGSEARQRGLYAHSQPAIIEQRGKIVPDGTVWGIDYTTWSVIHKSAIVLLSLLMIYHFIVHRKWYKAVFTKGLANKNIQVITLSFLFAVTALTGLVPWIVDLSGGNDSVRTVLIEIHDKVTILLTIFLILHVSGRIKWFKISYKKIAELKSE